MLAQSEQVWVVRLSLTTLHATPCLEALWQSCPRNIDQLASNTDFAMRVRANLDELTSPTVTDRPGFLAIVAAHRPFSRADRPWPKGRDEI
jgi:hypothetical protein